MCLLWGYGGDAPRQKGDTFYDFEVAVLFAHEKTGSNKSSYLDGISGRSGIVMLING